MKQGGTGGRPEAETIVQAIGYLTSQYPAPSHTFVQREVAALRRTGLMVDTFSIRRPPKGMTLSRTDRAERDATCYVLPARFFRLMGAHVQCVFRGPIRYARALLLALIICPAGCRALLWHLFYFNEAVVLAEDLRRRGIAHLHVHFAMACATVGLLASRLTGVPYSLTVHGPSDFFDVEKFALREKIRHAAMVFCISDFCRAQVMAMCRPEDWSKLHVVHCGVDPTAFTPAARNGGNGSVHMINVGRLAPVKGQALLLEAVAALDRHGRTVHCTIIGDGPERERLESLARRLKIAEQIEFAGYVNQDEMRRYLDCADIFVLPSFAEGVPVVLMEAMAAGVPVVATRIMGIPELVDDGCSGILVTPARVDELAAAIERILDDPQLADRLVRGGRRKVEEEFDINAIGRRISKLFTQSAPESVLSRRTAVPERPAPGVMAEAV